MFDTKLELLNLRSYSSQASKKAKMQINSNYQLQFFKDASQTKIQYFDYLKYQNIPSNQAS